MKESSNANEGFYIHIRPMLIISALRDSVNSCVYDLTEKTRGNPELNGLEQLKFSQISDHNVGDESPLYTIHADGYTVFVVSSERKQKM